MTHAETILILDFGSQYTQLIARRIREQNVYCEIHPHTFSLEEIKKLNPLGIIFSGGPMSVYDEGAPKISQEIFNLKIPILGICYGLQLIALNSEGKVEPAVKREYGKAELIVKEDSKLLENVSNNSIVWMSHGDYITGLPGEFQTIAGTENSPICAIANENDKIYGVQFHPEVIHTQEGKKIIRNYLFKICGCTGNWTPENFISSSIDEIKEKIGSKKAICALSGGVDSSVAAILVDQAIGKNLICIHVDTGLMRKNESRDIMKMFENEYNLNLISVDAESLFLERLKEVSDPEKKKNNR
ncbi:MAG: glutamine-hydrolyzing GMP synthase [Melioribacteraceae bacterium]|nr:glutamine-hydrolyzing GMP synthase [Melioribacteraceae bacterium]